MKIGHVALSFHRMHTHPMQAMYIIHGTRDILVTSKKYGSWKNKVVKKEQWAKTGFEKGNRRCLRKWKDRAWKGKNRVWARKKGSEIGEEGVWDRGKGVQKEQIRNLERTKTWSEQEQRRGLRKWKGGPEKKERSTPKKAGKGSRKSKGEQTRGLEITSDFDKKQWRSLRKSNGDKIEQRRGHEPTKKIQERTKRKGWEKHELEEKKGLRKSKGGPKKEQRRVRERTNQGNRTRKKGVEKEQRRLEEGQKLDFDKAPRRSQRTELSEWGRLNNIIHLLNICKSSTNDYYPNTIIPLRKQAILLQSKDSNVIRTKPK